MDCIIWIFFKKICEKKFSFCYNVFFHLMSLKPNFMYNFEKYQMNLYKFVREVPRGCVSVKFRSLFRYP